MNFRHRAAWFQQISQTIPFSSLPAGPPAPGTAQTLRGTLATVIGLMAALPTVQMSPRQWYVLCGQLSFRAGELVDRTITALRDDPGAFPETPLTADTLREWQTTADVWKQIACFLRAALALAEQNHVFHQAGAVSAARALLENTRLAAARPDVCPHLDAARREHALAPALIVDYELRRSAARRGSAGGRGHKAPPRTSPPQRPPQPSEKSRAAAALTALFEERSRAVRADE